MIKHRCRLEQRGFRPKQYYTDIVSFESKWLQCASWLPTSAASKRGGLPHAAERAAAGMGGKLLNAEGEQENVRALLKRLGAAGVSVDDLKAVEALAERAHALEL